MQSSLQTCVHQLGGFVSSTRWKRKEIDLVFPTFSSFNLDQYRFWRRSNEDIWSSAGWETELLKETISDWPRNTNYFNSPVLTHNNLCVNCVTVFSRITSLSEMADMALAKFFDLSRMAFVQIQIQSKMCWLYGLWWMQVALLTKAEENTTDFVGLRTDSIWWLFKLAFSR